MRDEIDDFLALRRWAVVGASTRPEKWGYKVVLNLIEGGYEVFPINPSASEVLGLPCYPSLSALPVRPDVVACIVPPSATEQVVEECARLGIGRVWLQPGAGSSGVVTRGAGLGVTVLPDVCLMVERSVRAPSFIRPSVVRPPSH